MWLPSEWLKITSLIACRDVISFYLLIIIAKATIKAIATMVTATSAEKTKVSICKRVCSTISITFLS